MAWIENLFKNRLIFAKIRETGPVFDKPAIQI
jgi:hypothetical protein